MDEHPYSAAILEREANVMSTMKAMRFNDSPDAPALIAENVPAPEPGEGEMLIRVRAAGVTPTELGWHPTTQELRPLVAGVVRMTEASAAYLGKAPHALGYGKLVIEVTGER